MRRQIPTPRPNIPSKNSEPISIYTLCGTQWPDGVPSEARKQTPAATEHSREKNNQSERCERQKCTERTACFSKLEEEMGRPNCLKCKL